MKYFFNVITALMLVGGLFAQSTEKAFREEIKAWDEKRMESLRSATGWVNLAGLFWLTPGENKFGAAADQQLRFNDPRFPAHLGSFILNDNEVIWKTAAGNEVYNKQEKVDQVVQFDIQKNQGVSLAYQTFRWTIIKRENMVGVRFRDLDHPNLKTFHHIERYKPSLKWKIEASLEERLFASVSITNVLGQTYQMPSPGKIVFEIEGKKYKLDAVDEGGDDLFILFADNTNAAHTYESGRFLYIPKPDANGKTVIDFNKSINPPCAFSTFATCPLPPKQNILPIAVPAGEKRVHLK